MAQQFTANRKWEPSAFDHEIIFYSQSKLCGPLDITAATRAPSNKSN
jgi:hypothetical protein